MQYSSSSTKECKTVNLPINMPRHVKHQSLKSKSVLEYKDKLMVPW